MKVYNDLLSAADNDQLSALCLLDLTAAFDTVDHELLVSRLERQFGTRVDYCNSVLAAAPKTTTGKLQRVLNAAARVVNNTRKFDRGLSQLLHDDLH